MATLREILAAHTPVLLLDAAPSRVQVGWIESTTTMRWRDSEEEAGVALFRCLESLNANPGDAGAFVFCDGPGSVLGCRTAAMAIRAWCVLARRPVFAYHSLALVAHAIGRADVTVISDARRSAWHAISPGSPLRRVCANELNGDLLTPENFRHWAPLPPNVAVTSYSLADLLARTLDAELFRPTESPDAFLHEEPSYATWTPQVHRAP